MPADPPPTVRRLVEADLEAAHRLLRDAFPSPWSPEQLRDELAREAWAIDAGGTLAGIACLSLVPPEAELLTIAVATAYRGRGFGGALLDRMTERAREAGCDELRLEVRATEAAAIALYRGRGFVEVGRRPGYYERGTVDALLMTARVAGRHDGGV